VRSSVAKQNETRWPAFDQFYEQYYRLVYGAAYGVTHHVEDAEDVLQNVFTDFLQRAEEITPEGNIGGYLYRAAVQQALQLIRNRQRERIAGDIDDFEDVVAADSPLEEATVESLRAAMTQLKPDEIELLALRYAQDYSDAQIAKMLGHSRMKVALKLYRARGHVKTIMHANQSAPATRKRGDVNKPTMASEGERR
jgi:RNA polymerase sigma-70 factor (ECF subfamily)